MSTNKDELQGISDFLSLYPAIAHYTLGKEVTNHQMRLLFAIYYIKQEDIKPLSRRRLASRSYFWPNVVNSGCEILINLGYLNPLHGKGKHIIISELGYTVIREILFNARSIRKTLTDPPIRKTVNRAKKRG